MGPPSPLAHCTSFGRRLFAHGICAYAHIPCTLVDMDASERTSRLVESLRREGRIDVAGAAAEFGTAEMTIRRDLDLLAERGVLRRVRGGAVSLLMRGEELPFSMRELESVGTKRRMAAVVAA